MNFRRTLIGGVGYRWQRDASFGLVATDEMMLQQWPAGIEVADLGYGAIHVAQDLADACPPYERLILVAGAQRDRRPGSAWRYGPDTSLPAAHEIQERIREAGAGVIDLDHLLVIARHFKALPPEVLVVELEPARSDYGVELSPEASQALPQIVSFIREQALAASWPETPQSEEIPWSGQFAL
jgi:hydrogenase maturation protease